jgi:antirestriction protein ArdC
MAGPDFSELTDQIIEAVKANPTAPDLPWRRTGLHLPSNALTGKAYRGVNVLALWARAMRRGYERPLWATYRQWAAVGAQVIRGEKGTPVLYFQEGAPASDETDKQRRPFARASIVFCVDQVSGYTHAPLPPPPIWDKYAPAEAFITATGADIRFGGDEAYYSRATDHIQLPHPEAFLDTATSTARDGYYSTALHELAHWTGAKKRLDRDLSGRFGSAAYAMEELVAELTAAFACAGLGVTPTLRPDHARYIANWAAVLRDDGRAIQTAASAASRAFDYLSRREVQSP